MQRLSTPLTTRASTKACRNVIVRSEVEVKSSSPASSDLKLPEWIPEQAAPVFAFLSSNDFKLEKLQSNELYSKYVKTYAENEWVVKSTGWKSIPETINGRGAMLGFLAGVGAEIFSGKSILQQMGSVPQPVVGILLLITFGSVYPLIQASEGEYLESLKDTYGLPKGMFTESMEKVHGRLAMVGLASLISIEMLKGSALF